MRNYEIYRQMFEMIPVYEECIRDYFIHSGFEVYCVFLRVADEDNGTYFADIEVGGSPEKYHHYYGVYSLKALQKMMV